MKFTDQQEIDYVSYKIKQYIEYSQDPTCWIARLEALYMKVLEEMSE